jgi:hypothetical protein
VKRSLIHYLNTRVYAKKKIYSEIGLVAFGGGCIWQHQLGKMKNLLVIRQLPPISSDLLPAQCAYQGRILIHQVLQDRYFIFQELYTRKMARTPFSGSLVEIWQCDEHKVYDNTTDEFRYRGSQRVGKNGKYQFTTIHPIPYPIDAAGTLYRPAHIHMRISGEGQQDLNHADIFSKMIHISKGTPRLNLLRQLTGF